jgi:hypothetical protein
VAQGEKGSLVLWTLTPASDDVFIKHHLAHAQEAVHDFEACIG